MSKKVLPFHFFIFVICVFVKFLPKYIDIETRGYEALQIMGNHGIIENGDRLNAIMNDTDFGKNIENADYLSYIYEILISIVKPTNILKVLKKNWFKKSL